MKNIIRINKAAFYAYHGVFKSEQNIGGKFEADIVIHTDFLSASSSDNLKQTIDYEKVYKVLYDVAISRKYFLIESLAEKMAEEIFNKFERADTVEIRIRKNNPPIGGVVDSVEVELSMTRAEFREKLK